MEIIRSHEEFKKIVEDYDGVVIAAIGPENCPTCEKYKPLFMKMLEQYKDYDFKAFRVIPDQECIEELKLCGPSLAVYKNHHLIALIPVEQFESEEDFIKNMKKMMETLFSKE